MRTCLTIVFGTLALAACATPIGPTPPRGAETSLPHGAQRQIVLSGELTRADHQTYREVPFTVPPGVARMIIDLSYTGREQRTVVDLGLRDPHGQRGWSGGNKSRIVIGEAGSTPSYRAGPITPGTWVLVLGIPNIRDDVSASFEATVTFESDGARSRLQGSGDARWLRGDFHTHTAHSDASCDNGQGLRVPCPVHRTLDAARAAGLDFVAITDHNTLSQLGSIRELEPAFPGLVIIPGSEITTFHGHANALGLARPLEFQLGSHRLRNLSPLLDAASEQNAIMSVNHPSQPSGETCMGCGWTLPDTNWGRVPAMEVANGATARLGLREGPVSGIPFWEARLNEGHRITGIGGSDNHDPLDTTGARQSPVGTPATVVRAVRADMGAILDGVREGAVFIDFENRPERSLEVEAKKGSAIAAMGATMILAPGEEATFHVTVAGVAVAQIEIVSGGLDVTQMASISTPSPDASFRLKDGSSRGWIRANIRDDSGTLQMIGNPVYIEAGPAQSATRPRE